MHFLTWLYLHVCISHFAMDFVAHLLFVMYFQNRSSVFYIYQTFISWHYLACLLCNVTELQAYYRLVQCQYQGLYLQSMLNVLAYKKLHCLVLKYCCLYIWPHSLPIDEMMTLLEMSISSLNPVCFYTYTNALQCSIQVNPLNTSILELVEWAFAKVTQINFLSCN